FFNDTATTEIYTLSLHDALPIWPGVRGERCAAPDRATVPVCDLRHRERGGVARGCRSGHACRTRSGAARGDHARRAAARAEATAGPPGVRERQRHEHRAPVGLLRDD